MNTYETPTKFWSGSLKRRGHSEDRGVDGSCNYGMESCRTGLIWLRIANSSGLVENGNETSGSIR